MTVSSATCTSLCRLFRQDWLRHLLLGLSVVTVLLSVVGMHQLSVGHSAVTNSSNHADASELPPTASGGHDPHGTTATAHSHSPTSHADSGPGVAGDECPTCENHEMALGACLMALTLLVLTWLLLPPRQRHLPPFLKPRRASAVIRLTYVRVVPALTLTELSLRRT